MAFSTDTPIDRLTLRVSSLLGVDIGQELEVYEVFRAPAMPVINEGEADHYICQNETATLNATVEGNAGAEVRWYDAMEGGNLVATTNTTTDFVTPNLATSTTYYAASSYTGCSEESPRTPINIEVRQTPTQSDISVSGDENPVCSSNSVVLTPSSNVAGTFRWYFDGNMNAEITDGMVNGSSTFNIDENGRLIVSGLNQGGSPFNYYVAVTDSLAGCTNFAGDLAHTQVEVVDFDKDITVSANIGKTIDDLISIFAGNTTETVNGTLTGDFVVGEEVILAINGTEYAGNVQSDASFSIAVDAIDLVSDLDQIIDVRLNNGICIANDEIAIGLPDLFVDATTQVFCGTDVSTVADLDLGNQNLVVFDDLYAGLQLDANTPLIDGEVYFAGLLNVPSSVLSRVAVTVQIDYIATPSTNANHQVYCDSELATVADLQVNETNIVFYDSASGGNIMDPDTILIDGGRYYAAQVQGNCESNRLRITVGLTADEHPAIVINGEIEDACINRSYTYTTHSKKTSYDWNVSGGTITEGGTAADDYVTVTWSETENAQISVSYSDTSGCNPDKSITLPVNTSSCGMVLGEEFCLRVFNEFSPNNDGFNEVFKIQCIEDYDNTVQIFNRNGNLVYKTVDYQNTWTGIANVNGVLNRGEQLPSGTYYYVIHIPELERNLVGWLQLARD